jgi:release factor glutamine methyltransferase
VTARLQAASQASEGAVAHPAQETSKRFVLPVEELTGHSLAAARRTLAQRLRRGGVDNPDLDARLLIGHALALDAAALVTQSQRVLAYDEAAAITRLAARRLMREPVSRIIGRKEFWKLSLRLNPQTFVPRPETETVVEAALAAAYPSLSRARTLRVADLGTGSGAVLLAILSELPESFGVGTDINVAALRCARDNAAGFGTRASFVACDYGAALDGPIDLLVSNPPYIAHEEVADLPPEVCCFDPLLALDGGSDGFDGYRAIAADARRLLAPAGVLVVELGFGQAAGVRSLFEAAGLACAPPQYDLCDIPRALVARPLA